MAALNNDEGCNNQEHSSSGNSAMYDNDDMNGILDINPDQKQTPGMAYSHNSNDNDIIAQINQTQYLEPGQTTSKQITNMTTMGETNISDYEDMPDLPKTPIPTTEYETKQSESTSYNSYNQKLHSAMRSLKSEINNSDQERKEIEILIDQEFDNIIKTLMTKKFQIIKDMNIFYDNQKQQSLKRINELGNEIKQNKINAQRKHKADVEYKKQLKKEQEEKAMIEKQNTEQELKNDTSHSDIPAGLQTHFKRLSFFGNSLKENASKLAVNATKFAGTAGKEILKAKDVVDSWINVDKDVFIEEKDLYYKHEKVRLSVPKTDLIGLIENKIKLTTEWWSLESLNHILFKIKDNELSRTNDINGGWFNAFGTNKVRQGQIKRWNIKICERIKNQKIGHGKRLLADVVFGIVESYKAKPQDKPGGFWMKPYNGFGIYGFNGKIFHMKDKGKMYCEALCVGQTIGIELNMKPTVGMGSNNEKSKPKMHLKNSKVFGLGGGVVKFYVDDEDLGIAFYDLDLNKQYSLAVALNSNAYVLQLCD